MFDKKGRWWPQRLAAKEDRKAWLDFYEAHCASGHVSDCPDCARSCVHCDFCSWMRRIGRQDSIYPEGWAKGP